MSPQRSMSRSDLPSKHYRPPSFPPRKLNIKAMFKGDSFVWKAKKKKSSSHMGRGLLCRYLHNVVRCIIFLEQVTPLVNTLLGGVCCSGEVVETGHTVSLMFSRGAHVES
jgi:hypothetical protein